MEQWAWFSLFMRVFEERQQDKPWPRTKEIRSKSNKLNTSEYTHWLLNSYKSPWKINKWNKFVPFSSDFMNSNVLSSQEDMVTYGLQVQAGPLCLESLGRSVDRGLDSRDLQPPTFCSVWSRHSTGGKRCWQPTKTPPGFPGPQRLSWCPHGRGGGLTLQPWGTW